MSLRQIDADTDADVGASLGSLQNTIDNIVDGERDPFENLVSVYTSEIVISAC
jgi:hypothetical protein